MISINWFKKRRDKKLKEEILIELSKYKGAERLDRALRYANKYPHLDIPTPPFHARR